MKTNLLAALLAVLVVVAQLFIMQHRLESDSGDQDVHDRKALDSNSELKTTEQVSLSFDWRQGSELRY